MKLLMDTSCSIRNCGEVFSGEELHCEGKQTPDLGPEQPVGSPPLQLFTMHLNKDLCKLPELLFFK